MALAQCRHGTLLSLACVWCHREGAYPTPPAAVDPDFAEIRRDLEEIKEILSRTEEIKEILSRMAGDAEQK